MDLHHHGIFELCTQEEDIEQETGQAKGRCKLPNTSNPLYVPAYVPKACPPEPNRDPRRYEGYCKPVPVLSQPLSHTEYLRKLSLNGWRPLSKSYLLQTPASLGKYRTTLWSAAGTSYKPSTAYGEDIGVIPTAPPVTGTLGNAQDSGTLTLTRIAVASRGDFSPLDKNGRVYDSSTTFKRMGKAIISNPNGFGGFNEACISCDLSGTSPSVIVGQFKCSCKGIDYNQYRGPFSLLWGQTSYGGSYTSPAVSNDGRLIYVGTMENVYALEAKTGYFIWSFSNPFTGDSFIYSNITVGPDGTLYFGGSQSSYFFAVDGLKGKMKWHYTTGNNDNFFASKPVLNGSVVYTTSCGPLATIYAFSVYGDLLYNYTNDDLVDNYTLVSPVVSTNGTVYIVYDNKLVALTRELVFKWQITCGSVNTTYNTEWYSPRIGPDGSIYVGSDQTSSVLLCFRDNGNSATLRWTYTPANQSIVTSPIFGPNGQVYIATNSVVGSRTSEILNAGSLVSINPTNGVAIWTYNFLGPSPDQYTNWIYPSVGPNGKIYISNIVDSGMVIINDLGSTFGYYKEIVNAEASSYVSGSLCLSPPVFGSEGAVFWANGNYSASSIFGAGYPIVTEIFEAPVAPVHTPSLQSALPSDMPLVPNVTNSNIANPNEPFVMRIKKGKKLI